MYLKDDFIVAKLGTVTMRSSKVSGMVNQFILDPEAVTGWTDGTNTRRSSVARPTSHGDFVETATASARLISFTGTAVASTAANLQVMRDQFIGVLSSGQYRDLSVETSSGIRYASVGIEGTPAWVQQTDTFASFRIELYAPDPRIYGASRTITVGAIDDIGGLIYPLSYPLVYLPLGYDTPPAATVKNHGNSEMWPIFKVTGDYPSGFTLFDNKGNQIIYSGDVSMSAPVIIDNAKGTATQSGADKSTLLTRRDWFSIKPGETIKPDYKPAQSGRGWCDIIVRDTWI